MTTIRILEPGPLTTVQDRGRLDQLRRAIPPSGPIDRRAFVIANRLVDNDDGAAALECTLMGPRFEAQASCAIAVTGIAAPVIAMAHPACASNRGPISVHSSAAAPSSLPTRRLAITNARRSTGPDGGMA